MRGASAARAGCASSSRRIWWCPRSCARPVFRARCARVAWCARPSAARSRSRACTRRSPAGAWRCSAPDPPDSSPRSCSRATAWPSTSWIAATRCAIAAAHSPPSSARACRTPSRICSSARAEPAPTPTASSTRAWLTRSRSRCSRNWSPAVRRPRSCTTRARTSAPTGCTTSCPHSARDSRRTACVSTGAPASTVWCSAAVRRAASARWRVRAGRFPARR
jgi:hypothetical protein